MTVYRRHSADCPHKAKRYHRGCSCPVWLQYQQNNKQVKETAKTRSWAEAQKMATAMELDADRMQRGEAPELPKAMPITIAQAVEKYVASKVTEGLAAGTIAKATNLCNRLVKYATDQGIVYLRDVSPSLLDDWRNTWKFKSGGSASMKVHYGVIKAFFGWAVRMDHIISDSSRKLNTIRVNHSQAQKQPYDRDEMSRILAAVDKLIWKGENIGHKVRALILLMRWSGLALQDAVSLERAKLDSQNRILTQRKKNGNEVLVKIPQPIADELRALPANGNHFFWNATATQSHATSEYYRYLGRVFQAAGITGTSHGFRHTFAVENLIAGMPLEILSKLMGHSSIAITQRAYSAWTKDRQSQVEAFQVMSFAKQGMIEGTSAIQ